MTTRVAFALVLALLTAACASDERPPAAGPETPITAGSPTPAGSMPLGERISEKSEIYAKVIRRLILRDHTFGGGKSPFKRIYVLDGINPDAASPMKDTLASPTKPFSADLKRDITEQLGSLPPIEFVEKAETVQRKRGDVRKDGVIIVLGPIEGNNQRVEVPNALWCGGLCAQWLTYVLKERSGSWTITGTTGPMAIS
jgi:hypothetical protein